MLGSGLVLLFAGLSVIAVQPLPGRFVFMVVWLGATGMELWRMQRAYARVRSYRLFCDGELEIELVDGRSTTACYAAGSVLLSRLAWLRVRAADGHCWGELIAGNPRKNKEWRRYQAICRQVGAC